MTPRGVLLLVLCTGCGEATGGSDEATGGGAGSSGASGAGGTGGAWPDAAGVGGTAGGGAAGIAGAAGTAGGSGSGGGAPGPYTEDDCIKAARNGSEICDDAAWKVEAPGTNLVLVCLTDAQGIIYVATNTGPPDPVDGIKRCQGWEINGQNAWEHLDYLHQMQCTAEQQKLDLDLSAFVGTTLYFGAHNHPNGSGQFTHMCLAHAK